MRLKSAYRGKLNKAPAEEIPEPNIPEIKIEGEPATVAAVSVADHDGENPQVAAAAKAASEADTAALALKRQIEALRQSEALQRQQQQHMAAQQAQPTREQKLAFWKSQGTDENELRFLEANPELIDIPELTAAAAAEAQQQGHKRGTEAHMNATRDLFRKYLEHMKAQATAQTPAFFAPTEPPAASAPSPASYVSAPVSREVHGSGYQRELSPSQVRLSADELAIAANSGITPTEYARHKIRLEREKRTGQRQ